ncbi:type IV pilus modification protein PilV [Limnohabitans sp.]|uniref:type IV pilus modification protein PilV n=1 Tax=Limnohabitans sp. TaxID=1907725 RepID=UPI00286F8587|nr:type IV pilus modification protein PilV [Limnohabitans sp.]
MQLNRVTGFALVEALVAMLVLAFGVLGLLWMHQHALVLQRQQLMRSVAAGIADDLAERMQLNAPQRAMYARTWGTSASATASASHNCAATACNRSELAQWDVQQLQTALQTQLPEGDAAVFNLADTPAWWGIVIAWRDATETYRTDTTAGTPPCPAQMSCWRLFLRPER